MLKESTMLHLPLTIYPDILKGHLVWIDIMKVVSCGMQMRVVRRGNIVCTKWPTLGQKSYVESGVSLFFLIFAFEEDGCLICASYIDASVRSTHLIQYTTELYLTSYLKGESPSMYSKYWCTGTVTNHFVRDGELLVENFSHLQAVVPRKHTISCVVYCIY